MATFEIKDEKDEEISIDTIALLSYVLVKHHPDGVVLPSPNDVLDAIDNHHLYIHPYTNNTRAAVIICLPDGGEA